MRAVYQKRTVVLFYFPYLSQGLNTLLGWKPHAYWPFDMAKQTGT